MGMSLNSIFAVDMPQFSMHLLEESVLLDALDAAAGNLTDTLDELSIAWCDGLACDANSGRWMLVEGLDPALRLHVIARPTSFIPSPRYVFNSDTYTQPQEAYWFMQAVADQGELLASCKTKLVHMKVHASLLQEPVW